MPNSVNPPHFWNTHIALFLGVIIGLVMFWRGCDSGHPMPSTAKNSIDSVEKKLKAKYEELLILKGLERPNDSIRTVTMVKWRTITIQAPDTCHTIILEAEKIFFQDSSRIVLLHEVISTQDTIIKDLRYVSAVKDTLLKSNRKFWNGFKVGFFTGAAVGISTNFLRR